MAVRTVEELLQAVANIVGDNNSDEALAFIEDVNDTVRDLDARTNDTTDWENRYNENNAEWERKYSELDNEWRNRYKERFFSASEVNDDEDFIDDVNDIKEQEEKPKTTYDELFETEGK
jgi:hypothetical protein